MARIARQERIVFREDTPDGTLITVQPGEAVEAEFVAVNDGDQRGLFHFEVEGLDERWTPNIGAAYAKAIDAGRKETLKLTLAPPPGSGARRSEFLVNIVSDGEVKFQKRVGLEIASPEPPVVEAPAAVEAPPATEPPRPASRRTAAKETPVPPAPVAPPADEIPITEAPKPARRKTSVARAVPPPAAPEPAAPPPMPEPERAAPPVVIPEAPPPAVIPPVRASAPALIPEPLEDDDDEFVDVEQYRARMPPPPSNEPEPEEITEPNLISPKPDTLIPLKPGETMLLRFPYVNETAQVREYAYDIEDARFDNERDWIDPVHPRMAFRNGDGELRVRLKAPVNARPGEYPLTIALGVDGTVDYLPLTLEVLASPAVLLAAKDHHIQAKAGPVAQPEFALLLRSAGNMDTSFRLGVTRARAGTDAAAQAQPVYESSDQKWRYLFDKEMSTVLVAKPGYEIQDVPINLRVARQNVGWWDFVAKDTLRVTAVPVTDVENSGKPGNTLELTASRWQIPRGITHILLPLLILLLILGPLFPVGNLQVANGYQGDPVKVADGSSVSTYYVFGPSANISWNPLPEHITGTPGGFAATAFGHVSAPVPPGDPKSNVTYVVKGPPVAVQFVPSDAPGTLEIQTGDLTLRHGQTVTLAPGTLTGAPAGVVVKTFSLNVPASGHQTINLINAVSRSSVQNSTLTYWIVKLPQDFMPKNYHHRQDVTAGGISAPIQISRGTATATESGDLILATNDPQAQLIDIKLTAE